MNRPKFLLAGLLLASAAAADEPRLRYTFADHTNSALCVAISPDGTIIASGGYDNMVRLWDLASGRPVANTERTDDRIESMAFSPDGCTLAFAVRGHRVKLWDLRTRRETTLLDEASDLGCPLVVFSADGKMLATGGTRIRAITLFDMSTGKPTASRMRPDGSSLRALAFAAGGKVLLAVSEPGGIRRWDVAAGKEAPFTLSAAETRHVEKLIDKLGDAAYSRREKASREIEAAGPLALHLLRSTRTGENAEVRGRLARLIERLEATSVAGQQGTAAAFSPDAQTLAVAVEDHAITLWDLATGRERAVLGAPRVPDTHSLAFSPDGRTLAAGHAHGFISLWDVSTGKQRAEFDAHAGAVQGLAFSPDGRTLASAGSRTVKVWDLAPMR